MNDGISTDLNQDDIEQGLGAIFSSILGDHYKQVNERMEKQLDNPETVEAIDALRSLDYEKFGHRYLHPHNEVAHALVGHALSKNPRLEFIIVHQDFVGRHLQTILKTIEGHASCADKERTVMRALIRFFHTGERIEFDYNGEYTYSLPKIILRDHESVIEYFESLYDLYYGKWNLYTQQMIKVAQIVKEIKAGNSPDSFASGELIS